MPLCFMRSHRAFYRERPRDGSKLEGVFFAFFSQIHCSTLALQKGKRLNTSVCVRRAMALKSQQELDVKCLRKYIQTGWIHFC